jgi:hypothetical protein
VVVSNQIRQGPSRAESEDGGSHAEPLGEVLQSGLQRVGIAHLRLGNLAKRDRRIAGPRERAADSAKEQDSPDDRERGRRRKQSGSERRGRERRGRRRQREAEAKSAIQVRRRRFPTKISSTSVPDLMGLQPKRSWNNSGSKNGVAPMAIKCSDPVRTENPNVEMRMVPRSMIGWVVRLRCRIAAAMMSMDRTPTATVSGTTTRLVESSAAVQVKPTSTAHVRNRPARSIGGGTACGSDSMSRHAAISAMAPKGTLTRNNQCQLA